jgi:hypothetical protein
MIQRRDDEVLPVTAARGQLYELVEAVLTGRRAKVELSHRGYDEHVLLVRKGELDGLHADNAALRSRVGGEPRPLRGRGKLNVPADQVLARTRARQAELARRKRADIAGREPDEG